MVSSQICASIPLGIIIDRIQYFFIPAFISRIINIHCDDIILWIIHKSEECCCLQRIHIVPTRNYQKQFTIIRNTR